jgi:hypothetical protein
VDSHKGGQTDALKVVLAEARGEVLRRATVRVVNFMVDGEREIPRRMWYVLERVGRTLVVR